MYKLKKSKLVFVIRAALISLVLSLCYIRFLFFTTPQQDVNKLNENSFSASNIRRKILTLDSPKNQYQQTRNCSKSAILEFPSDSLTRDQRQHGWIIVHTLLMFYAFWFLASIKDDYLVPSIEQICSNFNIDSNVIGATLMNAAVSSPGFFMNCIGTFITKGDIGVVTIVGSAVFHVLAVPTCCGLFVADYSKLNWRPITRDCLMYLVAVLVLLTILSDGHVWWYEALGLVLVYVWYVLIMYHKKKISHQAIKILRRIGIYKSRYKEVTEFTGLLSNKYKNGTKDGMTSKAYQSVEELGLNSCHINLYLEQQEREENFLSPWSCHQQTFGEVFFHWPITFMLWLTVPNSRKHKSLKYLTLILSLVWIAGISYIVAFVITAIGDTFNIPDAAMGLTILAAGMSLPEAVSSIILTKQGQGCMSLNSSLGSNTFDILICLGLPWFIKAFFLPEVADQQLLQFNSTNLLYAGIILLTALLGMYLVLVWNKFILNRRVGVSCLLMYIGLMAVAVLVELNVFFPVNLPKCGF